MKCVATLATANLLLYYWLLKKTPHRQEPLQSTTLTSGQTCTNWQARHSTVSSWLTAGHRLWGLGLWLSIWGGQYYVRGMIKVCVCVCLSTCIKDWHMRNAFIQGESKVLFGKHNERQACKYKCPQSQQGAELWKQFHLSNSNKTCKCAIWIQNRYLDPSYFVLPLYVYPAWHQHEGNWQLEPFPFQHVRTGPPPRLVQPKECARIGLFVHFETP